jgi:hypothetical protein
LKNSGIFSETKKTSEKLICIEVKEEKKNRTEYNPQTTNHILWSNPFA